MICALEILKFYVFSVVPRPFSYRDQSLGESLGETSYTILLGTPGPWENVKLILLGILLGTGPLENGKTGFS